MTFTHLHLTNRFLSLLIAIIVVLSLTLLASADGNEKVLYSFQGGTGDGAFPAGGVVFDKVGNLYGATTDGGGQCVPTQCGTVFQLAPPAKKGDPWTETVLYIFKGNGSGDGNTPAGSVIIDSVGNLYGTTGYGGTGDCVLLGTKVGCGTVYELSPPAKKGGAWTETVLYSFPTAKQGYLPNGNLVFDSVGNLYGATMFGGGYGTSCNDYYQYCGAVFELSPPAKKGGKWTEKVLHGFKGPTDGANPNGGLIFDGKGAIYGTTSAGGYDGGDCGAGGCGTVFMLKPPNTKGAAWTETILRVFDPGVSGAAEPTAGVIFDRGSLYGTTFGGGSSGQGTIFELSPRSNGSWAARVLYRFQDSMDGSQPRASLVLDAKGDLYGTATGGGSVGSGTFFSLRPAGGSWSFTALYDFGAKPDGAYPMGSLVFDGSGNLYGTTQYGGDGKACGNYGCGAVFWVKP
jgi:uncharacterized repeat protein (TIGR03803 family)